MRTEHNTNYAFPLIQREEQSVNLFRSVLLRFLRVRGQSIVILLWYYCILLSNGEITPFYPGFTLSFTYKSQSKLIQGFEIHILEVGNRLLNHSHVIIYIVCCVHTVGFLS